LLVEAMMDVMVSSWIDGPRRPLYMPATGQSCAWLAWLSFRLSQGIG
jgi:hypothetical protein